MVRITFICRSLCSICFKTFNKGSKSSSEVTRGRKRRTVPKELDFTGQNPIMVVNYPKKRRMAEEGAKKEKSADTVNERKTMVNYDINKKKLTTMVRINFF